MNIIVAAVRPDLAFYFSVEITTTTVSYTHAVTACVPFKVTVSDHTIVTVYLCYSILSLLQISG